MKIRYCEYTDTDYEGYVECLNRFYKGKHPYPKYFDKEFLKNLIASGHLIITLAKNEACKIIGTATAQLKDDEFENSVMLGMRYLDSEYRGKGIGKAQENYLLELVNLRFPDALSIYADVVMNTEISQRTLCNNGFKLTALTPMYFYEPSYKSLYPEDDYKLSMSVYAKPLTDVKTEIYVPEHYFDIVSNIYSSMGIVVKNGSGNCTGKSEYLSKPLEKHKTFKFVVTKNGADNTSLLSAIDDSLYNGDTVAVYINVSMPGSGYIIESLEKKSFYFCGVKPLNKVGEYIVFSNTQNHPGDLRNIQIPAQCREIADKIIGGIL